MPTFEKINFDKLLGTAAPDSDPLTLADHGLASKLFYDLQQNGFSLIYPSGTTNLWNEKEVVFEAQGPTGNPTGYVDPLGDSQPWRIGFKLDGHNYNQLWAYVGTSATMGDGTQGTPLGIDTLESAGCLLVQGGTKQFDTRISPSHLYSYRLTITHHGMAILTWENLGIEDMRKMGLLVVQRPVKADGTVLTENYAPVFALHNTSPDVGGRAQLSDRFYYHVVREKDRLIPTKTDLSIMQKVRHATGTVTLTKINRHTSWPLNVGSQNYTEQHDGLRLVLTMGYTDEPASQHLKVIVANNWGTDNIPSGQQCPVYASFNRGTLGPNAINGYTNNMYIVPGTSLSTTDMTANCQILRNALYNMYDVRAQACDYEVQNNNLFIIHKEAGAKGNKMKIGCTVEGLLNNNSQVSSTVNLAGGGEAITPPNGWVQINTVPENYDTITINGRVITFRTQAHIDSGVQFDPLNQVLVGNTALSTAYALATWLDANSASDASLRSATYTADFYAASPLNQRITIKLRSLEDNGSSFTLATSAPTSRISVSGAILNPPVKNQAYGYIYIKDNLDGGEVLNINGVNFEFKLLNANTALNQVKINPVELIAGADSTVNRLFKMLKDHTNPSVAAAAYELFVSDGTGTASDPLIIAKNEAIANNFEPPDESVQNVKAIIKITHRTIGYLGNRFTTQFLLGSDHKIECASPSLRHGAGFFAGEETFVFSNEVSDPITQHGTTMYQVPRKWSGPVTTDNGEYVMVFPFGFCSQRVAFVEELDLVAISKGPAYQGVQPVSIDVYGASRTYTGYNSNYATMDDYVRVFLLTAGGDI